MKILVVSDSHGNIANLKHVMGFGKKIKAEAVIHCGDWDNEVAVKIVLAYKIPVYSVLGNADIDQNIAKILEQRSKEFSEVFLEFDFDKRKIGMTHKPSDIGKYFAGRKLDVIFCGHHHSTFEGKVGEAKVIRPGAIVSGINFAVYDTVTNKIEFIEDGKT